MNEKDPLSGWRWLLWFVVGCAVGLVILQATII